MLPFFLFESPWLLCVITVRAMRVLALLNAMNYSIVVDQSDYSISTILYNNFTYPVCQHQKSGQRGLDNRGYTIPCYVTVASFIKL